MSDNDRSNLSKELTEKIKNPDLNHTETTRTASTVALKLKCQSCDYTEAVPVHDGQMMGIIEDSNQMKCEICGETRPLPQHHDQPMQPFIVGA